MEPISAVTQSRLVLRVVQIAFVAYALVIAASTVLAIANGAA